MNTPEIKEYINKHKTLFWYTPENEKENISEELLVEMILNYATLEDFYDLVDIMGIDKIASTFYTSINTSERKRGNYFPSILNFFDLVFKKYAH
jgi:hypothetical protein